MLTKRKHRHIWVIIGFIITGAFIVFLFPKGITSFSLQYESGKPWNHESLISEINFDVLKTEEEIKVEEELFSKNFPKYFIKNDEVLQQVKQKAIYQFENEFGISTSGLDSSVINARFYDHIHLIFDSIYHKGIVDSKILPKGNKKTVQVNINGAVFPYQINEFYTTQSALALFRKEFAALPKNSRAKVIQIVGDNLEPNIIYSEQITLQAKNDSLTTSLNKVKASYLKGQSLVSEGEIITKNKSDIIDAYQANLIKKSKIKGRMWSIYLGRGILVSILLSALYFFLLLFRATITKSIRKASSILSLILLIVGLTFWVYTSEKLHIYIIPFAILPIMIRAFFDSRLALFTHLITILVCAEYAPNGYEFIILQMIAGIIGIFTFVNFRRRAQLFITVSIIFCSYIFVNTAFSLISESNFKTTNYNDYIWFLISCFGTLFAFPMIYIYEKIFGLYSEFTLLELSDTNTSLLKELSIKAPGTFQHSIQVANLAEDAIDHIGGNALLIRTAALYHDIGKMVEPQYFIENQISGVNPHDQLTFEQSAKKIIAHVEYGIEIAKKKRLPQEIIDFIRTHHGTSTVQYFYRNYIKSFPNEQVDKKLFSYKGPIPFSKETAVLMMADSVEAASRSMHEPNYEKIQQLVDKIIDYQIAEKQFDNSNLTFKEITTIKNVFKKKLMNIYHVRIEYPQ